MKNSEWFAVAVRLQREQLCASNFSTLGIEQFWPHYSETRHWKKRAAETVQRPLFPGYIFVHIQRHERDSIERNVPYVLGMVDSCGFLLPVEDVEIRRLRASMEANARPCHYLSAGEKVWIINGPLEGHCGILLRRKNSSTVVISVEMIQRSVSVEIQEDWLKSCNGFIINLPTDTQRFGLDLDLAKLTDEELEQIIAHGETKLTGEQLEHIAQSHQQQDQPISRAQLTRIWAGSAPASKENHHLPIPFEIWWQQFEVVASKLPA